MKQTEYGRLRARIPQFILALYGLVMDPILLDEPVSSRANAFRAAVEHALSQNERLVVLFRYANCGGAKDYFVARNLCEFDSVVEPARAKTSMTVFFLDNFLFRGATKSDTADRLIGLLPSVIDENKGLDIVRLDGATTLLNDEQYLYLRSHDEIVDWVKRNQEVPILAGSMAFWRDNSEKMLTVYVPDDDGVVRPGAY